MKRSCGTDSRYLTDDMESAVPALASSAATICGVVAADPVLASQVCDSAKVSDHHAIVPTRSAATADLSALPMGEHEVLRLVRAVCPSHRYAETAVTVECGGHSFTAKGKTVLDMGWRACVKPVKDALLPDNLAQGQTLAVEAVQVKEGQTISPKHFTEVICYERGIRNRP